MNQKKNKEKTAPISEDAFLDLPVKYRPKSGNRAVMRRKRKLHKITMWDQLPSTDSGFWLNDFTPIERSTEGRLDYDKAGNLFPSPPHGWFSNWTKNEMEKLEHTVGVDDNRFFTKRRRMKRTNKILRILESGIPAWTPCDSAAEYARNQRNLHKKECRMLISFCKDDRFDQCSQSKANTET